MLPLVLPSLLIPEMEHTVPPSHHHTCRTHRGQWEGQRGYASFGRALNVVGAVASLYHASSGRLRPLLRKADYYAIAVASAMMRGAAFGGGSRPPLAVTLAMLAVLPFKPTLVTAGNLIAVEVSPTRPHECLRLFKLPPPTATRPAHTNASCSSWPACPPMCLRVTSRYSTSVWTEG